MTCEHCNGPGNGESQCCWARAKQIEKFRKKVFRSYILEVLFEMIISISSVVTDITSLIFYIINGKWGLAALTALPVILPTTVFTNVYLSNKHHQSINSLSGQTGSSSTPPSSDLTKEKVNGENVQDEELQGETQLDDEGQRCFTAKTCCRGCYQSFCHKDLNIRRGGKKIVKRYLRRSAKYFFGTLVLRFIAWTWYLKALIFGYKALKSPKKFMKMASPDSHWSYELLTRLDFLQAALENAPQCVIQLYALLTDGYEERGLGILTLVLSFVDFVRVATAVQWNIGKGPVIAPKGCYGSSLWKFINTCSWILLYSARGCAIALVMATSNGWTIVYPIIGFFIHMLVFAKLFSSTKFGVAAQKVIVTSFISIFFLPELDSEQVDILIQFYYAALLLENTLFIIPWRGLEYVYCDNLSGNSGNTKSTISHSVTADPLSGSSTAEPQSCLIQPVLVVLIVPAFTVLGIILRIAAARKVARFKANHPETETPMTMEERVASIYNRKWTKLTYRDLLAAFVRMLRKEVSPKDPNAKENTDKNKSSSRSNSILLISGTLGEDLKASHTFIRKSFSMIVRSREEDAAKLTTTDSQEKRLTYPRVKDPTSNPYINLENSFKARQEFQEDLPKDQESALTTVPKTFFAPAYTQNTASSASGTIFRNLEVKLLKVESPEGSVVEMEEWM